MGQCLLVICLLLAAAALGTRTLFVPLSFAELANHGLSDDPPGDSAEDIRRFAEELFGQVVGVSDQEARHNICSRFGTHCETHVGRAELVADYAYYMYHLVPPGEDEQIPFATFKGELMGNLTGQFLGVRGYVQGASTSLHKVRSFLDTNKEAYNEVQDFRWWVFFRWVFNHPKNFHYTRRVSINVPAKARPAFAGCILRELLDKDVVQGMKFAMIHAPGFEGLPVPVSVSDNVILYLARHHDLDAAVEGAQACEPPGGFRRPPRLMRLLGQTGVQIAAGVDDSADHSSYGARLREVFREAYQLMVTHDHLPPCCREAGCWEGLQVLLPRFLWSNGSAVTIERYQDAVCVIAEQFERQDKFSMLS